VAGGPGFEPGLTESESAMRAREGSGARPPAFSPAGTGSSIDVKCSIMNSPKRPWERYVLMRTESALSGTRRADLVGFGVP
jgi:hypothetical protein